MPAVDVAIVGGGPGGLTAAAAILTKSPKLQVRVFERESRLRRVGNFLALSPNGASALKALEPKVWERVEKDFVEEGDIIFSDFEKEGVIPTRSVLSKSVPWYKLREGLSEVLPQDCLKLGYKLQDLVQEDNGVSLNFSSPEESYHAKVVIGCDGYRSQVREICLKDGPPTFKNTICWRGIAGWPGYWPHPKSQKAFWKNHGVFGVSGIIEDQYLGWQIFVPLEKEDVDSLPYSSSLHLSSTGMEYKNRCIDALEEYWPKYLVKAIKDTPPENVTEHGIFARDPATCGTWGKGSITLLGDAAHAMTPAVGQGLNQALVDAAELGRAIGELGASDEALRQYESVRIGAMQPIQKGSWDVQDGLQSEIEWHQQNPWCVSHVVQPL